MFLFHKFQVQKLPLVYCASLIADPAVLEMVMFDLVVLDPVVLDLGVLSYWMMTQSIYKAKFS